MEHDIDIIYSISLTDENKIQQRLSDSMVLAEVCAIRVLQVGQKNRFSFVVVYNQLKCSLSFICWSDKPYRRGVWGGGGGGGLSWKALICNVIRSVLPRQQGSGSILCGY